MRRPDIPVLTTLRFPAAFAIVLYHFFVYTHCPSWIWEGFGSGVSFFYVLSGFILYYNYSDLTDRGFFWVARFGRIWPVHLCTLVLAFVLIPFRYLDGHDSWWITLPANIFLIHAWLPFQGSALSYNGVSWSLSVEAFFYICFPWSLGLLQRKGATQPLVASFALGFTIILLATIFARAHANFVGTFNPACRVFEFILGMATCRLWMEGAQKTTATGRWSGYELFILILSVTLVIGLPAIIHGLGVANPTSFWLGGEMNAFGFAALIWTYAHQAGAISRILSARYLEWFGEISFAVYMCHQIILRWLGAAMMPDPLDALSFFLPYLALTLGLSAAIFHLVETPVRRAIVSAYKRRQVRVVPG